MGCIIQKTLPKADLVLQRLPLPDDLSHEVGRSRAEICDILKGKDPRKILIVGPCSAWPSEAVVEYAEKLKPVADKVSDQIKVVLRSYIQKPRTRLGWLGPLNQVDPFLPPDIEAGIFYCREMMIKVLEIGLPLADEALFTHNDSYFVDLLSWIAVGARSTEDQEHRIFASMIPHPVGFKNPVSGNVQVGVNSIVAAQHPHVCALHGKQILTSGNPFAHYILRGGDGQPNYSLYKLQKTARLMKEAGVLNRAIIVDASHDNSIDETGKKNPHRQPQVIREVLESMVHDKEVGLAVKGFMMESFLKNGKQDLEKFKCVSDLEYGISITDACLGFEETEKCVLELAELLKKSLVLSR